MVFQQDGVGDREEWPCRRSPRRRYRYHSHSVEKCYTVSSRWIHACR